MQALIVDDNSEDCARLLRHLCAAGYTCITVASVQQAQQALLTHSFELLLLEIHLPDGNSFALCNEIRERLGDSPVIIFISHWATQAKRVVGLLLGADDCIYKPCAAEELLARIDAHRRRRVATR